MIECDRSALEVLVSQNDGGRGTIYYLLLLGSTTTTTATNSLRIIHANAHLHVPFGPRRRRKN
jgi:hypothetical protein